MKALRWSAPAAGLALCLSATPVVHAQVERRGGEASAALLEQIQELSSERTSLQADNTKMKQELDELQKKYDSLKSGQKAADARVRDDAAALARSEAQHTADERELSLYKQKMDELIGKFRETIETLRQTEIARATTQRELATRNSELKVCTDRNTALYQLNQQVLHRWEKQSFWSRLAMADPFTKIAQTRLENLVDDYTSHAQDQQLTPEKLRAAAATAAPRPAPGSAPANGPAAQGGSASGAPGTPVPPGSNSPRGP